MTIEVDAPARLIRTGTCNATPRASAARVGFRPTVPVSYPDGHHHRLLIVQAVTEQPLGEIRAAKIDKPTWVLNGIGPMSFTMSAYDPAIDHLVNQATIVDGAGILHLIGREIQLWRDGVLIWAGVPVTARVNLDGTVVITCYDLGWYLSRKFFGAAERRDWLNGIGSMDRRGLPGWTPTGDCTAHRSLAVKNRGIGSAALSGAGTLDASFTHPTIDRGQDQVIRLTGRVRLPAGTPVGTGIMTVTVRGLAGGAIVAQESVSVDGETSIGGWTDADVTVKVPLYGPHYVTVSLWSLGTHGTTYFDDVRVLRNDTTGSGSEDWDLARHISAGLDHVQRGRGQGPGFGFKPVIITPSGTTERLGVRHLEHTQFTDWMQTYTERSDAVDCWIDPAKRWFCISDRRGVDHQNIVIHQRIASSGGWVHDEQEKSSKIVVIGDGDGADRPEGGYTDASTTDGLYLDWAERPANSTPLSALDPLAVQVWQQKSQPQQIPDSLTVPDTYLPYLEPGDRVQTRLRVGRVRMQSQIRIGQLALDIEAGKLELA